LPVITGNGISIVGPGSGSISVDGAGLYRAFEVAAGVTGASISALTIKSATGSFSSCGGGIRTAGELTLQSVVITLCQMNCPGDTAFSFAGSAVAVPAGGSLVMQSSTVSSNEAGAVAVRGTATLVASTVEGTAAGGPAITCGSSCAITMRQCTVASNLNGGLAVSNGGQATLSSCTFTANDGTNYGAVWLTGGGATSVTMDNTVLSGNTGQDLLIVEVGTVVDNGYNFVGVSTGYTFSDATDITGNSNPQLGALANNGGQTRTCAPLSGSPIIEAGTTSAATLALLGANDQRGAGFARVSGARLDIGAVEFQQSADWP
jgi:hypothetical protein